MGKQTHSHERLTLVANVCQKFPNAGNITLARKLFNEHPGLFATVNQANCAVRHHRGNRGARSVRSAEKRNTARPNGVSGAVPPLPESLAKPRVPYILDTKRLLVLSDIHAPFHDNAAIEAALEFGERFKPDTILLNGDCLDFQAISRFARDPRGPTIKQELEIFADVLRNIRARFRKAKIKFRLGNHEERWEHMLWLRAPEILDIAEFAWEKLAGIGECRVEVVRGRRPIMAGKLPIWHGHEKGKQLSAPVNQARGMFLRYLSSALEGHGHRTSEHTERSDDGRTYTCRSTGCLCGLWPDYAVINKWDQSIASVEVAKDETYECQLHRIIDGKMY